MNNHSNHAKTALITGASGGIGYELAKLFAFDRYNLVLVARSEQKLKEIAEDFKSQFGVFVKVIVKDLSLANAPEEIFEQLQQEGMKIDVLVNNAGFATYGFFAETDLKSQLQMMQLNMVALTHLTKLFLKDMIAQKEGKILNIASTAAFQPGPLMAVYYASKAYVLSFSEAIANELKGTGVTVTALCPGPTESGFEKRADLGDSKLFNQQLMDATTVAKIGYQGLMNHKPVVIAGLKNQLLAFSVRFLPRSLVTQIARNLQESV
ncbi:short-chain dehydrogenase/reductase SDR [Gloeothece citriformis PCC 7424]|uniref:Short-chain dehydrogenase/reductase SDR n=1 Tax=Gloeothece citriformis (strain PCC 7424) TaxID=65393 RepID=B7KBM6_GLOC7|nr:SDR family oxidoreductase [Gloeothece citriformis]ACK73004.1 short-chain dehydrogenase/reductase SDR [Gloeothece citriformis PCC 7424]